MAIDPKRIAGVYRHYKGNLYRVLCVAKHSETLEDMVVYQDAIDEAKVWAPPFHVERGSGRRRQEVAAVSTPRDRRRHAG